MHQIRVLVVDDHPVVREGIRNLLEKVPDIAVVGEAANGAEAISLANKLVPDILLIDMDMPGLSGVDVARRLVAARSPVRVVALSAYDDPEYIVGLLSTGAAGYLTKDEAPAMIIDAVRGVARGEEGWISGRATAALVGRKQAENLWPVADIPSFSPREGQVLGMLARGLSNDEIAAALEISDGTVKNHVSNLYDKLQVRTRAEAVAWVWKKGLVT